MKKIFAAAYNRPGFLFYATLKEGETTLTENSKEASPLTEEQYQGLLPDSTLAWGRGFSADEAANEAAQEACCKW